MKKFLTITILLVILSCLNTRKINIQHLERNIEKRNLQQLTDQPPLVTSQPANHLQWRQQLTAGMSKLVKKGYPGRAMVFGLNSSVVTVGDNIYDILIAAGQVGNGRVVVITHNSYVENFLQGNNSDANIKTFHSNVKKWVTKGTYVNSSNLMDAYAFLKCTNATTLQNVKALYYTQNSTYWTDENKTKILEFVRNGGGLYMGTCPWGYAQGRNIATFDVMLTYKTILQAGIGLTQNVIWGSSYFYFTKSTYLSHIGIQVDIVLSPASSAFNYSIARTLADQIQYLDLTAFKVLKSRYDAFLNSTQIQAMVPSATNKITTISAKTKIIYYQKIIQSGYFNVAAVDSSTFPGNVDITDQSFAYVQKNITITGDGIEDYVQSGYYAVPGQTVTFQIIGAAPTVGTWTVYIGFHLDNDESQSTWVRWPVLYLKRDFRVTSFNVSCPFGGLIVFKKPSTSYQTVTFKVSHIVQAPLYDSQSIDSINDWPRRKLALGAWGCAQGKYVGYCMPRASFANVTDPSQILNQYDNIHVAYHDLRGSNVALDRKRFIIGDISPSVGYMHSGYPIVTSMDVVTPTYSQFQFNYTALKSLGQWGIFHQMGHNMQRGWWTPPGTGEVTNNIYSLLATQMIIGKSPKNAPWLINQKKSASSYLLAPNFTTWKNSAGIALMIYAQIVEDFGWDAYKHVFSSYELGDSTTYPTDEQGIIDFFWSKMSLEVGQDLSSLLTKWGIPYSTNFTAKVSGLPAYTQVVNLFA